MVTLSYDKMNIRLTTTEKLVVKKRDIYRLSRWMNIKDKADSIEKPKIEAKIDNVLKKMVNDVNAYNSKNGNPRQLSTSEINAIVSALKESNNFYYNIPRRARELHRQHASYKQVSFLLNAAILALTTFLGFAWLTNGSPGAKIGAIFCAALDVIANVGIEFTGTKGKRIELGKRIQIITQTNMP